jgi:hypothetical protein
MKSEVKVDMSPPAITARLRRVAQLRRLCLALGKARPIAKAAIAPAHVATSQPPNSQSLSDKTA